MQLASVTYWPFLARQPQFHMSDPPACLRVPNQLQGMGQTSVAVGNWPATDLINPTTREMDGASDVSSFLLTVHQQRLNTQPRFSCLVTLSTFGSSLSISSPRVAVGCICPACSQALFIVSAPTSLLCMQASQAGSLAVHKRTKPTT